MSAHPIDPHIAVIARIHPQAAINYIEALHAIDAILAPRRPVADTRLPTIQTVASNTAEKQAAIEDVAIIADMPTPSPTDGGGGPMPSTIENDTDDSQELASVSSEIEALSVIASTERADGAIVSDSTSPKANGGGGDTMYFDRPSRPPGLSKLQAGVWDWIEANADGRAATNLSATIVHKGTGRARGVCGKLLTQYRGWTDSMERTA